MDAATDLFAFWLPLSQTLTNPTAQTTAGNVKLQDPLQNAWALGRCGIVDFGVVGIVLVFHHRDN